MDMKMRQQIADALSGYFGKWDLKEYTLFTKQAARDQKSYFPNQLMDLSKAKKWSFEVVNSTDQDITVQLIGGSFASSKGLLGAGGIVPAGTTQPVATDVWLPYLGLTFQAVTAAPTSGDVTIYGTVQERTP